MKPNENTPNADETKTWEHLGRHDDDPALMVPGTAGNVSTLPHADAESERRIHAMQDRDEQTDDDDRDEEDEESHKSDWGDVDPQHDSRSPRSPMDPSAPGSAV
ncbi:hypothetical protein HYN48_01550 [Flavobacterium magnum]|uniref:Uncharacterized protein n=1 Tax=Flavobacterium magnum TaxID=2162713 RepID=A0A2S0RBE3_9FLAO|nr:hypothetical protein [Flavobacterium magnum]AWA28875.1 hypothetical protein HYN48_01550 [Flavobacterium magnum]